MDSYLHKELTQYHIFNTIGSRVLQDFASHYSNFQIKIFNKISGRVYLATVGDPRAVQGQDLVKVKSQGSIFYLDCSTLRIEQGRIQGGLWGSGDSLQKYIREAKRMRYWYKNTLFLTFQLYDKTTYMFQGVAPTIPPIWFKTSLYLLKYALNLH